MPFRFDLDGDGQIDDNELEQALQAGLDQTTMSASASPCLVRSSTQKSMGIHTYMHSRVRAWPAQLSCPSA